MKCHCDIDILVGPLRLTDVDTLYIFILYDPTLYIYLLSTVEHLTGQGSKDYIRIWSRMDEKIWHVGWMVLDPTCLKFVMSSFNVLCSL